MQVQVQYVPRWDKRWISTVHTEHCCVIHGCKYDIDEFCPVACGVFQQSRYCESCTEEFHLRK